MQTPFRSLAALFVLGVLLASTASSQAVLNQIIVVNGGTFGDPLDQVTLATVQPDLTGYTVFDVIDTEAAQDIAVRGNRAWVAALDSVVVYDIDTYDRLATIALPGVNKIEPFGDFILVGRGFGASSDFLQIRNAEDLSLVADLPVSAETGRMVLDANRAYVSVPGDFFATEGKLAVVDLVSQSLLKEIDLGTDGAGVDGLFLESGRVLALCSKSGLLLAVEPESETYQSLPLGSFSTYGTAVRQDNKLYFQYGDFFNPRLGVFDIGSKSTLDDSLIVGSFAEVAINPLNGDIYRTTTDFFSTGTLYHHAPDGTELSSLPIGISAEHLGMDIRGNCHSPVGLTASPSATEVLISWNAVSGADSYRLFGRTSGSGGLSSIPVSGTSKTVNGLAPSTSYEYTVRAVCGTENSDFATVQMFSTPTTRLAGFSFLQGSDYLELRGEFGHYEVHDLQGRLITAGELNNNLLISTADWTSGLYLVVWRSGSESQTFKVAVTR